MKLKSFAIIQKSTLPTILLETTPKGSGCKSTLAIFRTASEFVKEKKILKILAPSDISSISENFVQK